MDKKTLERANEIVADLSKIELKCSKLSQIVKYLSSQTRERVNTCYLCLDDFPQAKCIVDIFANSYFGLHIISACEAELRILQKKKEALETELKHL